jgi:predicted DNA-binding helix-hairpin-helix protein
VGNASRGGICHSWSADGRCISLLKVLLTNHCIYDCAYCVNRRSNDMPRASFEVRELVDLTLSFYRRNYIEGLFLSSGIERSPDETMARMNAVARQLRERGFGGYIHLKAIPGSSAELVREAGLLADRLSVNIELPSEQSLSLLAPQKRRGDVLKPMRWIGDGIAENREERLAKRRPPAFASAGQSTQLIVGASPETDRHILRLS